MVVCGFNRPLDVNDPFDKELERVVDNVTTVLQKIHERRDVAGMYGLANAAAGVAARMGLKLPSIMIPAVMPKSPYEVGEAVINAVVAESKERGGDVTL